MKKNSVDETYDGLEVHEQVYLRPTTYVGSIFNTLTDVYVCEKNDNKINILKKNVDFNAGFIKIFDEVITNSSDQYIKYGKVKNIYVNVGDDFISVENDGDGIPNEIHTKFGIYAPELIFGRMFSGENYKDDKENREVAGMNGMGVKLTNIFSKKFIVENADGKQLFYQEFYDNLKNRNQPKLKKCSKNYVKITYFPDFQKFGIEKNTDEIKSILYRRCCDVAAYCNKVKIFFNNEIVDIKSFKNYVESHLIDNSEIIYDKLEEEKWEIAIASNSNMKKFQKPIEINYDEIDYEAISETELENLNKIDKEFNHVSIVNGINTYVGGTHVEYVMNIIVNEIKNYLQKTNKKLHIKNTDIRNNIQLFLMVKINNPVFDNQSKVKLVSKINTNINLSDSFIRKILKSKLVEDILQDILFKNNIDLNKKLSNSKAKTVRIKKLEDANLAGTKDSDKCSLILTEGDSAKGFITNSLSKEMRNYYGVYSLKGKILNVKKAGIADIKNNDEINDISKILGLEYGKKYKDLTELRYSKLILATDSDVDGLHIKGLIINFFDSFFPELLELGFVYEFVAPILRIGKVGGKDTKYIYTLNDYLKIKNNNNPDTDITYFKGLGTITEAEGEMFFKNIKKHLLQFKQDNSEECRKLIKMIFTDEKDLDKTKASDKRKEWLLSYTFKEVVDKFLGQSIEKFFYEEYIEYSMESNIRQIPSVFDGLKPAQRKVLHTAFKLNLKKKLKVSELYGSINTISNYHHSPASMEQCIIGMGQDFTGSNNISYLQKEGNFGSRLKGGKDAAAARYLFTNLSDITRNVFDSNDENVLDYIFEEGKFIEPIYFIPIIPNILVNGSNGMGTGWSSDIPSYNPMELITYIENKLNNKKNIVLHPWYRNYKGSIIFDNEKSCYKSKGIYELKSNTVKKVVNKEKVEVVNNELIIKELPIGMWSDIYGDYLDKLIDDKKIKNYFKNCAKNEVDFTIELNPNTTYDDKEIVSLFKLETSISVNNMHAFDKNLKIKKYNNVYEILEDFYDMRMGYYQKRKDYLISKLEYELKIIINKIKFLAAIVKNEISITKKTKAEIIKILEDINIIKINDSYDYILDMNLWSLSKEKLEELKEKYNKIKNDIQTINDVDLKTMWLNDLDVLKKNYKKLYK